MRSIKSRKQRKELFNAPLHRRRKWISSHLEENLLLKYDKRRIPLIKGDTVKVMRGIFKGHEDKVVHVNVRKRHVEIEGMTMTKADNKKIAKPIHASNLIITKLNLTDKWRRKKLEQDLSEDTKKEIEKEAKEQIKEIEEEQKRKAEEEDEVKEEESIDETKETSIDETKEAKEKIEEPKKKKVTKKIEKNDNKKDLKQKNKVKKINNPNKKDKKIEKTIEKKKTPSKSIKKKTEEKNE
jgi:large subunit ribosomal protein L24